MNVKDDIVTWPRHYRKIPKPFYVVRCDDHFQVCELDKDMNLIDDLTVIHWNHYLVRRWALDIASESVDKRQKESLD